LVLGYDGSDENALSRRLAVREAHIRLGDELRDAGHMLYGVAMLNDAQQMCGSMLVVQFADRAALDAWLAREPYMTGKVWERIEIVPCKVGPSFQHLAPRTEPHRQGGTV
jgi:uncharacterized protein YciI